MYLLWNKKKSVIIGKIGEGGGGGGGGGGGEGSQSLKYLRE